MEKITAFVEKIERLLRRPKSRRMADTTFVRLNQWHWVLAVFSLAGQVGAYAVGFSAEAEWFEYVSNGVVALVAATVAFFVFSEFSGPRYTIVSDAGELRFLLARGVFGKTFSVSYSNIVKIVYGNGYQKERFAWFPVSENINSSVVVIVVRDGPELKFTARGVDVEDFYEGLSRARDAGIPVDYSLSEMKE